MKGKKRIVSLMLAVAVLLAAPAGAYLGAATSPGAIACAKTSHKGRKYLADVYTGDKFFRYVKYANNRNVFGEKLGKSDSMGAQKELLKYKFIDYTFNMYYDPIQSARSNGFQMYGDYNGTAQEGRYTSGYWYGSNIIYDRAGTQYTWNGTRYVDANGRYYDDDSYYDVSHVYRNSADDAWRWAVDIGLVGEKEKRKAKVTYGWAYNVLKKLAYYVDGNRNLKFSNTNSGKMRKLDGVRVLAVLSMDTRYDVDEMWYWSNR